MYTFTYITVNYLEYLVTLWNNADWKASYQAQWFVGILALKILAFSYISAWNNNKLNPVPEVPSKFKGLPTMQVMMPVHFHYLSIGGCAELVYNDLLARHISNLILKKTKQTNKKDS